MIKWHLGNIKERKEQKMENYVKETEIAKRKKLPFFFHSPHILGIFFFITYSGLILTEHTALCIFIYVLSIIACIGGVGSALEYSEEEKTVAKKIRKGSNRT